jgi:hypothetical protein
MKKAAHPALGTRLAGIHCCTATTQVPDTPRRNLQGNENQVSLISILAELAEVGIAQKKIGEALANSPEVQAAVIAKTNQARDYWREIAPVRTGEYRDSITASFEKGENGELIGKVESRLNPKARLLEYGSIHNPEYACAQKTADAMGGHFGGTPSTNALDADD